jgi:hypothetical protein
MAMRRTFGSGVGVGTGVGGTGVAVGGAFVAGGFVGPAIGVGVAAGRHPTSVITKAITCNISSTRFILLPPSVLSQISSDCKSRVDTSYSPSSSVF